LNDYFCLKAFLISSLASILSNPIEYLKGVGPQRGELLKKELGIFTFADMLDHFPYRHVDKTKVNFINEINQQTDYIQLTGVLLNFEIVGNKAGKRLVAQIKDKTGFLELIWFQGINWIQKILQPGHSYLVYGKVGFYMGNPQIIHPEIEALTLDKKDGKSFLDPVYPTTEKLKSKGLGGRQIGKLTQPLLAMLKEKDIPHVWHVDSNAHDNNEWDNNLYLFAQRLFKK